LASPLLQILGVELGGGVFVVVFVKTLVAVGEGVGVYIGVLVFVGNVVEV